MTSDLELTLEMSQLFKVLSDQNRIRLLLLLQENKELNVTSLANKLNMEQSAVSHQLQVLRSKHLVKARREGKAVYYQLDDDHIKYLLDTTMVHIKHSK